MSFLWGSSKPEEPKTVAAANNNDLQQRLGFDPSQVSSLNQAINLDAAKLHPLAELEKGVEYLDIEGESILSSEGSQNGFLPSRGFNDDLCYGTGTVYLSALSLGGAYGFVEGIRNIPRGTTSGKLRLNTILNHITKRGPFLGNSAGVLAITYNIINSSFGALKGKHDDWNSLAAGFLTGAIFKSSKGLKPMGLSAALMTGVAAAWCGVKRLAN
ncbi:protein transporter [Saccharomycopsis crataegensis]|uniref:Protein transporter n=1 Tax=Saccharomycopsis crataegensis TaxID=43959 RepID=A0AAV5QSX2_9ASCO|nr:protein transporter [Saccharomycopsis crataegensis]